MTVWLTHKGKVVASIHIWPTSWVYFLIFWLKKKSNRSYHFFSPNPSGSSWPPLTVYAPTWRPVVWLHPVPILLSVLQEPLCPAPTFLYPPSPSRTLCSNQPSLYPSLALRLFLVLMSALLFHLHSHFDHFFLSQGPLPSYSSPEWSHSPPNPWNMSSLYRMFKKTHHLLICLCNWALIGAHRPELLEHREDRPNQGWHGFY